MFPVINFPLEDQENEMAIVEIGSPLFDARGGILGGMTPKNKAVPV